MPFRPPKKPPQFADLKGILAQSKNTEHPVYQTIQQIIERLDLTKEVTQEQIGNLGDSVTQVNKNIAPKTATYITKNNESAQLPNSLQLLAGIGIILDYTVANKLTVSSTGGAGGAYAPMSTGAEPLEVMSDGAGSVLMIGFAE